MWHTHNILGLIVVLATIYTCMEVYSYVDWEQKLNAHSLLGLFALVLTLFVGITGAITSGMMRWYKGD